MTRLSLWFLLMIAAPLPEVASAQDAGEQYHSDYRAFGFRLRAAYACPGDKARAIQKAAGPGASKDEKAFAQAFPKTVDDWLHEGAGAFNDGVMKFGITRMCAAIRQQP